MASVDTESVLTAGSQPTRLRYFLAVLCYGFVVAWITRRNTMGNDHTNSRLARSGVVLHGTAPSNNLSVSPLSKENKTLPLSKENKILPLALLSRPTYLPSNVTVFLCGYSREDIANIVLPAAKKVFWDTRGKRNVTKSDFLFHGIGSMKRRCPSNFPGVVVRINAERNFF